MLRYATMALVMLVGAVAAEEQVLLDDQWEADLKLNGTECSVIEKAAPGDPAVRFGDAAVQLTNRTGAPQVRFSNAGRVKAGQLVPGETELQLWYRTDRWNGRWNAELWAWHRAVSDHTFRLLGGALDGGGPQGRLIADGEWHEAVAVLEASEEFARVEPGFQVPLFVMLAPTSGWDVEHTWRQGRCHPWSSTSPSGSSGLSRPRAIVCSGSRRRRASRRHWTRPAPAMS
jgi:hypothetical protein